MVVALVVLALAVGFEEVAVLLVRVVEEGTVVWAGLLVDSPEEVVVVVAWVGLVEVPLDDCVLDEPEAV